MMISNPYKTFSGFECIVLYGNNKLSFFKKKNYLVLFIVIIYRGQSLDFHFRIEG